MKQMIEIDVPDGYEVDTTFTSSGSVPRPRIETYLKPKQTKDFNWCVDQYLAESRVTVDNLAGWINDRDLEVAKNRLKTKQFNLVCWEIKMGLFVFICEEFKYGWFAAYTSVKYDNADSDKLKEIIPQEFINDLFKQNESI